MVCSFRYSKLLVWLTSLLLLLQDGAGIVVVVVVRSAAVYVSFGCLISYRNSGMMGTATEKQQIRHFIVIRGSLNAYL